MTTSPRDDVRAQLVEHRTRDQRERASRDATLALLERDDAFSLDNPHHVTASAFVLSSRGIILHRHRLLGRWLQPGGHIDEGERPEQAALRETLEETGLTGHLAHGSTMCHVDVHAGPRGHTHYDLRYFVTSPPDDPAPGAGESPEVHWFSFDDALAIVEPELRGVIADLRDGFTPT